MRGYRSTEATGRHSATAVFGAALLPASRPAKVTHLGSSVAIDERTESTLVMFGVHQWKPNALVEPPVE